MLNIKNGKVKCVGYNRDERCFTVGKVYDVVDNTITNDNGFKYKYSRSLMGDSLLGWLGGWYKWEVVPAEKIIITHDYKTTTATLYRGNEKVVATIKCAPEDKFDFMIGAKLAMERLNDEINPKYYNGKVVCIKAGTDHWTVGKVYEVKDGIVHCNYGWVHPRFNAKPYRDEADIRHIGGTPWADERHNPDNEFVPLIED